ncbi:nucleophosmin-like [Tupaia chinensis]|uniref:nucleophosmin-like n=1 Tax=Tupaia chinensis TaxID=246437 RepID=UPI00070469C6|nr:nucleophosmin-like [Tupaia chinensis]
MEDSMDMDVSPLRPQNYLSGCELKADKDYHFKVDNDENEHQLSLRTVSLGADAKDELHIVEAEAMNYEGSPIKVTLATLKMSVQPTVSLGGFEITPLVLKCGSGPVHISGQHLVAAEEDAESEEEEEEDVKLLSISGKRSAPGGGSKFPQKKVKLAADKDDDDEDDDDDDDDDFEDEETEEKAPVKKSIRDTPGKNAPTKASGTAAATTTMESTNMGHNNSTTLAKYGALTLEALCNCTGHTLLKIALVPVRLIGIKPITKHMKSQRLSDLSLPHEAVGKIEVNGGCGKGFVKTERPGEQGWAPKMSSYRERCLPTNPSPMSGLYVCVAAGLLKAVRALPGSRKDLYGKVGKTAGKFSYGKSSPAASLYYWAKRGFLEGCFLFTL